MIVEAINSALSQDYPNFEIIVSDNFSNDGTWEECVIRYQDNSKVILHRNSQNLGPVANWLSAAQVARGDYVKFLFSDDLLLEGCIKLMASALVDEIGFVYSSCLIGSSIQSSRIAFLRRHIFGHIHHVFRSSHGLMRYALVAGSHVPVSPGAAMFRRLDVLRSLEYSLRNPACVEALETGAGPDINLFLDSLCNYPFYAYVNQPLVFFRAHSGSFSEGSRRQAVLRGYDAARAVFFAKQPLKYQLISRLSQFAKALKHFLVIITR